MSSGGQIVWQKEFSVSDTSNNYGVSLTLDNSNNIYVAGCFYEPASLSKYDVLVLKYSSSGVKLWETQYKGSGNGDDTAVGIIVDNSSNVAYVIGPTFSQTSQNDYLTLKLDAGDGSIAWTKTYDYSGGHDVPTALSLNTNGEIVVTGGTSSNILDWDITTIKYNSSGQLLGQNIIINAQLGLDKPADLITDSQGNIYVTGSTTSQEGDTDIHTIKLDSSLTLVWDHIYDANGSNDEPTSLSFGIGNDIYITGFASTNNSKKESVVLKYDTSGKMLWEKFYGAQNETEDMIPIKGVANHLGELFITSLIEGNAHSYLATLQIDSFGQIKWYKEYVDTSHNPVKPTDINVDTSGNVYVLGITKQLSQIATDGEYFIIKYNLLNLNRTFVIDSLETPLHVNDEIIIEFDTSVVHMANIDNIDLRFGPLWKFVESDAIDSMSEKIGFDFTRIIAFKVFPYLTSCAKFSTTRMGRTIPVYPFWSTFVLILPSGSNEEGISDSLNLPSEYINFAETNKVGWPLVGANDPLYINSSQEALYDSPGGINIEPGWDIETGISSVSVGVFDSGINWKHEEFGNGIFANSKIKPGYDYYNDIPLSTTSSNDGNGHGTKVAGIIGAQRDNFKGIAGVAGGDGDQNDKGCTLFDMKTFGPAGELPNPPPPLMPYDIVANAIVDGAINSGCFGTGLDIQNHSWGKGHSQILKNAVKTVFENEVVFVAGAGNTGNCFTIVYPSYYNDSWVMKVGANDASGQRASFSTCGFALDYLAPGTTDIVTTTGPDGINDYVSFSGTSAATAYVSGLAALMLSYVNTHPQKPNNLSPEDCENLIKRYCVNSIFPPIYDDDYGFGKINAGKTLEYITLPTYKIVHHQVNISTSNAVLVGSQEKVLIVYYKEKFDDLANAKHYKVNRYQVTATAQHTIGSDALLSAWVRNAASNLYPDYQNNPPVTADGAFTKDVGIELVDVTPTSATLRGYIYEFLNSDGTSTGIWYPFDLNNTTANFAYSLYLGNPSVSTKGLIDDKQISVFPNPANEITTLKFNADLNFERVSIFNSRGQLEKDISIYDQKQVEIPCADLSEGLYILKAYNGKEIYTTKLVIHH